jgi:aminotransferase
MRRAAQRLSGLGTSVFSEMSRLAVEHQAINLGQGFPDFPGPDFVKEAAEQAIRADLNQYAPSHGAARLRRAIAADWSGRFGREVDPDSEVTVTTGATEALMVAMLAFVDPGDEVVFFEPFYDAYVPDVRWAGGEPRVVRLHPPDWSFDPDELRAAINDRTRILLLNTPHNPTGKVFTRAELLEIGALCEEFDALLFTDEIYEHIVYQPATHVPLWTIDGMADRTVAINSTSKTFSVTGWRVGWAVAPPDIAPAIRKVHDFLTVGAAAPLQAAAAAALNAPGDYYRDLTERYRQRRDRLLAILNGAGFPCLTPQGAYYVMTTFDGMGFDDDVEFVRYLVTEIGVAAVPGSSFFGDSAAGRQFVRFCFCKKEETLAEAERRLEKLQVGMRRV